MKKLIVGFTGLCMCTSAWAAGTPAFMRESVQSADQAVVANGNLGLSLKGGNGGANGGPVIVLGPSNDECTGAINIPCPAGSVQADNTGASTNPNDPAFPCHFGGATNPGFASIWYSFVATSPEAIVSTCTEVSGGDSVLQVFGPFASVAAGCANLGTNVACNDDFGCGSTGFLSEVLLPNLTVGQTYIIEVAAWAQGDEGVYQVDLDCSLAGACCIPSATPTCNNGQQPGQCIDAGGIWQGDGSTCASVVCVPEPTVCPPGSINESGGASSTFGGEPNCGQPAPDAFNSGCNVTGGAFTFLLADGCNASVCGESSADLRNGGSGGRDTDWYFLVPSETTQYTACAVAPFYAEVSWWELDPGIDPCATSRLLDAEFGAPGTNVCNSECALRGNPYAIRVTIVDANGAAQRFGVGCVNYRLTTTCADCVSGACCVGTNCIQGTFPVGNPYAGEVVTQVNCEAQDGVYLGDGATCAGVQCEAACCLPNGTCDLQPRQTCVNNGGAWFEGAECADVEPCPMCTGEDPNNLDGVNGTAEDCTALGGDVVNSGCTTDAPGTLFSPISCGQTVCASTAFDGGFRDLDWYHMSVPSSTEAIFTFTNNTVGTADFRIRYYCQQTGLGAPACSTAGAFVLVTETGDAPARLIPSGQTVSFPRPLGPGRYTLLVTYDFTNPVQDCPTNSCCNYRITVDCSSTVCAVTRSCQANEGEANCGDPNEINPGCSATPPGARTPLPLNTRVCGDTRMVRTDSPSAGSRVRDIDTYLVNITQAGTYDFRIEAEFHALVFLQPLGGPGGCDDDAVFGFLIFQCGSIPYDPAFNGTTISADLTPGQYELLITPDFTSYNASLIGATCGTVTPPPPNTQELCPAEYELEVTSGGGPDPCAGIICGDSNLSGGTSVSDIAFFVTAVAQGFAAWDAALPGAQTMDQFLCANDTDGNGQVSVGDIGRFVSVITGNPPGCQ